MISSLPQLYYTVGMLKIGKATKKHRFGGSSMKEKQRDKVGPFSTTELHR
jgi:hypothetical protein